MSVSPGGTRIKYLILFLSLSQGLDSLAQNLEPRSSLTKLGGIFQFNPSGYSINFEHERGFLKNSRFTHGLRVDFNKISPYPQKFFPGVENLVLGYQLKLYPFSKEEFRGFFTGVYPCYFVKRKDRYRYGPGLGGLIGYQYIRKRLSLSIESSIVYMQNVNEKVPSKNPEDRYFFLFLNIKAGLRHR